MGVILTTCKSWDDPPSILTRWNNSFLSQVWCRLQFYVQLYLTILVCTSFHAFAVSFKEKSMNKCNSSFQGRIFWGERIADVEVGPVEPQKQQILISSVWFWPPEHLNGNLYITYSIARLGHNKNSSLHSIFPIFVKRSGVFSFLPKKGHLFPNLSCLEIFPSLPRADRTINTLLPESWTWKMGPLQDLLPLD